MRVGDQKSGGSEKIGLSNDGIHDTQFSMLVSLTTVYFRNHLFTRLPNMQNLRKLETLLVHPSVPAANCDVPGLLSARRNHACMLLRSDQPDMLLGLYVGHSTQLQSNTMQRQPDPNLSASTQTRPNDMRSFILCMLNTPPTPVLTGRCSYVAHNLITSIAPGDFKGLISLVHFSIGGNAIATVAPEAFWNMAALGVTPGNFTPTVNLNGWCRVPRRMRAVPTRSAFATLLYSDRWWCATAVAAGPA